MAQLENLDEAGERGAFIAESKHPDYAGVALRDFENIQEFQDNHEKTVIAFYDGSVESQRFLSDVWTQAAHDLSAVDLALMNVASCGDQLASVHKIHSGDIPAMILKTKGQDPQKHIIRKSQTSEVNDSLQLTVGSLAQSQDRSYNTTPRFHYVRLHLRMWPERRSSSK